MKNLMFSIAAATALFLTGNIMPAHGQAGGKAVVETRAASQQVNRSRLQLERAIQNDPRLREQLSAAAKAKDLRKLRALLAESGVHGAVNQGGPTDSVYCESLGEMTTEFDCMIITVLCATC